MDLPQHRHNSGMYAAVDSDNDSDGLDHADIDHRAGVNAKRAARFANPPRPTPAPSASFPAANASPPLNNAAATPNNKKGVGHATVTDADKPFALVAAAKKRPDGGKSKPRPGPAPLDGMSELEQMQAMIRKRNNALFDQKQEAAAHSTERTRAPTPPPPPATAVVVAAKSDNSETAIQRNNRILAMMTGGKR